jgi:putative ABC transport system permease protein
MDPGFDRERVLTMRLTLPPQKYQGAAIGAFFDALVARVGALPGVESSAAASQFPPRVVFSTRVRVEGAPSTGEGALPTAGFTHVTPGFFDVLGIPLRVGRAIDARDRPGTPRVAVVNEAFVRRYLGGGTPIGRRVALAGDERDAPWFEVVGVAGDTRSRGPASPPSPEIFLPVGQLGDVWNQLFLLVRTAGDPRSILPAVREAVRHLDADQPVYAIQTLDDVFDAARLQPRVSSWLMGAFAALALVVAAVGLYGVLSYAVTARTREIGIRMALGADRSRVIGHVVGQAGVLLGIGAGMGVVGVLALGPLMTRLLQGLTPRDPVTIVLAIGVLLLTGIVATLVPARRASRVDPVVALRSD